MSNQLTTLAGVGGGGGTVIHLMCDTEGVHCTHPQSRSVSTYRNPATPLKWEAQIRRKLYFSMIHSGQQKRATDQRFFFITLLYWTTNNAILVLALVPVLLEFLFLFTYSFHTRTRVILPRAEKAILNKNTRSSGAFNCSVADPDPPDPHVFGPPGSGSTSQRYGSGSGSGSGSFYHHHAKIVRKTWIPTILWLFLTFYIWKMM